MWGYCSCVVFYWFTRGSEMYQAKGKPRVAFTESDDGIRWRRNLEICSRGSELCRVNGSNAEMGEAVVGRTSHVLLSYPTTITYGGKLSSYTGRKGWRSIRGIIFRSAPLTSPMVRPNQAEEPILGRIRMYKRNRWARTGSWRPPGACDPFTPPPSRPNRIHR